MDSDQEVESEFNLADIGSEVQEMKFFYEGVRNSHRSSISSQGKLDNLGQNPWTQFTLSKEFEFAQWFNQRG